MLGLLRYDPEEWFQGDRDRKTIDAAIEARLAARKARDWAEADRIRAELLSKGIALEDGPAGTTWRVVPPMETT
jgi:cysteinyl-tRNA synthetase